MNGALNERAMLANLSIGSWEGRKKDKQITEETVKAAKAERDAGAWWTRTLPPRLFKRIQAAINNGRSIHRKLTLPWDDSGTRILPSKMFIEYTKLLREARAEFESAVSEFAKEYPAAVQEAAKRLGKLYHPDQFPKEVRHKFYWEVNFTPLPDAKDFRVDLGAEETAQVRESIEKSVAERIAKSSGDLWARLFDVVSRVAERLAEPDRIFRDSMITHVTELCDLLPQLNVTGDANLERLRKEIATKIAKCKPDDLRNDQEQREKTAKAAASILDQMKAFMPKEMQ